MVGIYVHVKTQYPVLGTDDALASCWTISFPESSQADIRLAHRQLEQQRLALSRPSPEEDGKHHIMPLFAWVGYLAVESVVLWWKNITRYSDEDLELDRMIHRVAELMARPLDIELNHICMKHLPSLWPWIIHMNKHHESSKVVVKLQQPLSPHLLDELNQMIWQEGCGDDVYLVQPPSSAPSPFKPKPESNKEQPNEVELDSMAAMENSKSEKENLDHQDLMFIIDSMKRTLGVGTGGTTTTIAGREIQVKLWDALTSLCYLDPSSIQMNPLSQTVSRRNGQHHPFLFLQHFANDREARAGLQECLDQGWIELIPKPGQSSMARSLPCDFKSIILSNFIYLRPIVQMAFQRLYENEQVYLEIHEMKIQLDRLVVGSLGIPKRTDLR